jgi:uncharacterized membrane protein YgaE (UPF0421/DUF939 family)
MLSRIRYLRRQIAIYRRALQGIENLDLWERYTKDLEAAEAELKRLKTPEGRDAHERENAAFTAKFGR